MRASGGLKGFGRSELDAVTAPCRPRWRAPWPGFGGGRIPGGEKKRKGTFVNNVAASWLVSEL